MVELLGRQAVEVDDDHSTLGPLASAQDLQQLQRWRALVVAGSLPPTVIRYQPYWRIRGRAVACGDTEPDKQTV